MDRNHRYIITYTGNMGNCMLQVMIARALMAALGPGEIVVNQQRIRDRLEPWRLELGLEPELPPGRFVVDKRVRSIPKIAKAIRQGGQADIQIATCNIHTSQYLPVEEMRAIFQPPPGLEVPRFGKDELVINVRGGKVLRGIHRDYVVPPPSFYRSLIETTGLRPVFYGQIAKDDYSNLLRASFPDATFMPGISPIVDFEALRRAHNIVCCVSTFSMLAAWMSEAERVFFPLLGLFSPFQRKDSQHAPLDDPRYRFFLFPIFYMEPMERILDKLEACLGRWREVSPAMLRAMQATSPRIAPDLAESLERFDVERYVARYPDIARALADGTITDARAHYEAHGHAEGRDPCGVNDMWYSKAYPLAAWEVGNGEFANLAQHYIAIGALRGYRPRPDA